MNAEGQAQLSKAQGPVRVAVTGRSVGPPLFESLEALGKERTLARLRAAASEPAVTALAEPEVIGSARPRRRWGRWLSRAVLVVLVLLAAYVAVTFVQVYRASRHDGARAADAIIVLGAAQYDGTPSPVLQDRLDHALALYEDGLADHIVLTGGRQEGDRFTEATAGYNYLRDQGVPDEALMKEVDGTSTWESLRASARFLIGPWAHRGRPRDRRLPRLPGGGDRRGDRPRRHACPRRTPA